MNIPWLPFSRTAVLWIALSLALVLMLVGHWAVMSSGAIFDPSTGAGFGITTQWVSDYAASGRQGLWIKFAIVAFCFALVEFFAAQIRSSTTRRLRAWGVLGLAMIVGLLVAVFD